MTLSAILETPNPTPRIWRGWEVLLATFLAILFLVIGIVVTIVAVLVIHLDGDFTTWRQIEFSTLFSNSTRLIVVMTWLSAFCFVLGPAIVALLRGKLRWANFGLRAPTWLGWALAIFGGIVTMIAMSAASVIMQFLLQKVGFYPDGLENPQMDSIVPPGLTITPLFAVLMTIGVGILVPIAEEFLFRGMVYRYLRDKWGVWWAVPISAVLFGLAHIEPSVACGAAVAGVILALSYEFTQSLWVPITIHAINNGIKIALIYLLVLTGVVQF